MRNTFKLQNLDCANCAAKIERKISKLNGVQNVSVNFLVQKLTLECSDDMYGEVLSVLQKTVSSVEPDCKVIIK